MSYILYINDTNIMHSLSGSLDSIDSTSCGICFISYDDIHNPIYILSCSHKICLACIENIRRSKIVKACPYCSNSKDPIWKDLNNTNYGNIIAINANPNTNLNTNTNTNINTLNNRNNNSNNMNNTNNNTNNNEQTEDTNINIAINNQDANIPLLYNENNHIAQRIVTILFCFFFLMCFIVIFVLFYSRI